MKRIILCKLSQMPCKGLGAGWNKSDVEFRGTRIGAGLLSACTDQI